MYRVITISREFGSGGRTIGREVARQLGIKCYDSELIEKIAEESGLARDYIADKGEYAAHSNWFANAFAASRSYSGMSTQDYLWTVQRKIILDLAEKESCVIVGRCADYILQDRNDCLRVFFTRICKSAPSALSRCTAKPTSLPKSGLPTRTSGARRITAFTPIWSGAGRSTITCALTAASWDLTNART